MAMLIKNNRNNAEKLIIFLLALGFIVPLAGFLSMAMCNKSSFNDCLYETRFVFPDFFYKYNIIRYIYHHGSFPSYLIISDLGGEDGTKSDGVLRYIYHSPLYYYFGAFIFLIAKKTGMSDLFLLYFSSLVMLFFVNLFFFFNIRYISKQIYKKLDNNFIIYSLAIFLFLPVHLHLSTGIQDDTALYLLYMVALFYYFKVLKHKDVKCSVILGLVLGVSLLVRIASLIVIGGFCLHMVYLHFRKEKRLRNCLFISLLISTVVGAYPFIRNMILYKNPIGDMRYDLAMRIHKNIFYTFFRVFRAYFGGIFGGNEHIKVILGLFLIVLCTLVILGILFYLKNHQNNDTNLFLFIGLSTLIISFLYMCKVSYYLKYGVCQGDTVQDRFLTPLNPLVAVFASIALVKVKGLIKNKNFKILPDIFIGILASLLVIDFLTAVIFI